VFIFTTSDEYMRRAFVNRGWVENTTTNVFDIRWDLNENAVDFSQLRQGQLCNHFPSNQELTTKIGLNRNLLRATYCEPWFPRCYDFTEEKQIQEFVKDFQYSSIVNFVKKHAQYFKSIHEDEMKEIKRNRSKRYKERYLPLPDGNKNKINIILLKAAISFVEYRIKIRIEVTEEGKTHKWFKYKKSIKNIFDTLVTLGQLNVPPYSSSILKEYSEIITDGWTVPSSHLEYKAIAVLKEYNKIYPQSKITGCNNIWVVKPSFSSRGIGVHCINSPKDELFTVKKTKAKVIQKYIERTFLLSIPSQNGRLEKRKFDLRQWVLVTSISPLIVYMFNSCYLKICGSEFTLDDFKDKYKHISNYTIQKKNEKVNNIKSDLIMSVPQFVEHIRRHYGIRLDWENEMIPKLAKIIKETMYAGWDVIEHKANSFELLGFDFVLDYKLNPWLIEVNLSPACSERTDWLIDMLGKGNIK